MLSFSRSANKDYTPQGYTNSPALCQTGRQGLCHFIPLDIVLVCHTNLLDPEAENCNYSRHMYSGGWEVSLTKMLGLGEIPRRPVVWDMSRCPFFPLRTTHSTYWVFLDFGGNKYLIWTFFSNPFTKVTQKAASFEGGAQKKTKLCNRPRLPGKLLYHLGFMTWQMW